MMFDCRSFEDLNGVVETAVIIPAGRFLGTVCVLYRYHHSFALDRRAKVADEPVRRSIAAPGLISRLAIVVSVPLVGGVSDHNSLFVGQVHHTNGAFHRDEAGRSRFDLASF